MHICSWHNKFYGKDLTIHYTHVPSYSRCCFPLFPHATLLLGHYVLLVTPLRLSSAEESGGDVAATRPGTQEASAGGARLWPGGTEEHRDGSPKLLRINTHSSGIKTSKPFDHGLDTFRSHSIEVRHLAGQVIWGMLE